MEITVGCLYLRKTLSLTANGIWDCLCCIHPILDFVKYKSALFRFQFFSSRCLSLSLSLSLVWIKRIQLISSVYKSDFEYRVHFISVFFCCFSFGLRSEFGAWNCYLVNILKFNWLEWGKINIWLLSEHYKHIERTNKYSGWMKHKLPWQQTIKNLLIARIILLVEWNGQTKKKM